MNPSSFSVFYLLLVVTILQLFGICWFLVGVDSLMYLEFIFYSESSGMNIIMLGLHFGGWLL